MFHRNRDWQTIAKKQGLANYCKIKQKHGLANYCKLKGGVVEYTVGNYLLKAAIDPGDFYVLSVLVEKFNSLH